VAETLKRISIPTAGPVIEAGRRVQGETSEGGTDQSKQTIRVQAGPIR